MNTTVTFDCMGLSAVGLENQPQPINFGNGDFTLSPMYSLSEIKQEIDEILNSIDGITNINFREIKYKWIAKCDSNDIGISLYQNDEAKYIFDYKWTAKYYGNDFGISLYQNHEDQYIFDMYHITGYGDRMWFSNVKDRVYDLIVSKNMIHSRWPLPRSMETIMSTLRASYPKESENELTILAEAMMKEESYEWWRPNA
jgi:hypothetical protein